MEAAINTNYSYEDAKKFLDNYINNKGQPSYVGVKKLTYKKSILEKISTKIRIEGLGIILYPFRILYRILFNFWLWIESSLLKKIVQISQ